MTHQTDDLGYPKLPALNKQVGGEHYLNQKIQPVEYNMANRLDFCAGSIVEYVSRHASKNGRQDLLKAQHFIELRHHTISPSYKQPKAEVRAEYYCRVNGLGEKEQRVLMALEAWCAEDSWPRQRELLAAMADLISTYPAD